VYNSNMNTPTKLTEDQVREIFETWYRKQNPTWAEFDLVRKDHPLNDYASGNANMQWDAFLAASLLLATEDTTENDLFIERYENSYGEKP
jgi:hypothetical protein